jgi:hypothetical protein
MKAKLERVRDRLIDYRDQANDDEVSDELDSALIHLEAAIDRLIQIDEEEEEEDSDE